MTSADSILKIAGVGLATGVAVGTLKAVNLPFDKQKKKKTVKKCNYF